MKNDCVFGDDLDVDEITFVSEVNINTHIHTHLCNSLNIEKETFTSLTFK